ncbi:MAG: FHA domain-containing protein [Fimbriimonadaceae bacterium]|nr:FHA domain-containing protein [Fimbriimonadaceae bacterium]
MNDDLQSPSADAAEAVDSPLEPSADADHADGSDAAATPTGAARLILMRSKAETDIEFPVVAPAIIGRFDPTVGPIDVDLGALIPEGTYVSRRHARISLQDGAYHVEDLGSSNGTFLLRTDFERVDTAELTDGDVIAFGNAQFAFRLS